MNEVSKDLASRRTVLSAMTAILTAACAPLRGQQNNVPPSRQASPIMVGIETDLGLIQISVEQAKAPKVAAWFLALVNSGKLNGTRFFRSGHLAGQVSRARFIEGGMLSSFLLGEAGTRPANAAQAGLPQLSDWETTKQSGMTHIRGSVGFARDITGSGAVIPDLVITVEDVPELDMGGGFSPGNLGFPVVGQVVSGMHIVDQIAAGSREGRTYVPMLAGQILTQPIAIQRVFRLDAEGEARP